MNINAPFRRPPVALTVAMGLVAQGLLLAEPHSAASHPITASQYDENWPYDYRTAFAYVNGGGTAEELDTVRWVGRFFDGRGTTSPGDFIIRAYGDSEGRPSDLWWETQVQAESEPLEDGCLEYEVTLEQPLVLPPYTKIWIEIQDQRSALPQWGLGEIRAPAASSSRVVLAERLGFREWTPLSPPPNAGSRAKSNPEVHVTNQQPTCQLSRFSLGSEFELLLTAAHPVDLSVVAFDAVGRSLGELTSTRVSGTVSVPARLPPGTSSGCYFVQVRAEGQGVLLTKKLVVVK